MGRDYSTADFSKLGVHEIRVVNPLWQPAFVNTDTSVSLLKLD